jgi:ceramide glucosyltransferase
MNLGEGWLIIWWILSIGSTLGVMILGLWKVKTWNSAPVQARDLSSIEPIEVLIPVKGVFPHQQEVLEWVLVQDYPAYEVQFIVETEEDSANEAVDALCSRYDHARKTVAGVSTTCAQKNHNLNAGIRNLRERTTLLVFCDSTNTAGPEWLTDFTAPLRRKEVEVVTTFRSFRPVPQTLAGICQAIYASMLLLLITLIPKPWGGATGIRRSLFERLDVSSIWARSVVDDLVLGNVLFAAGIPVVTDPRLVLISPVRRQSWRGFLAYLDRQILFPKFTNPGLWLTTLVLFLNLTLAMSAAWVFSVLFLIGRVDGTVGLIALTCSGAILVTVLGLHGTNPHASSRGKWLLALLPCVLLTAALFVRSLFVFTIDWHGRRYRVGAGGTVVPPVSDVNGLPQPDRQARAGKKDRKPVRAGLS